MKPQIADGVERIVMMGGACRELGNRTMTSEFNMLADPHAAHMVFSSGIPLVARALADPSRRQNRRIISYRCRRGADRMGKKLACHFVGYGEKAEKSPYSSAPSRPLGTTCSLMKLTSG